MFRRNIFKILFLILFWSCCTLFIVFYDASVTTIKSEIGEATDFNFGRLVGIAILGTLVGASVLGTIEVLVLTDVVTRFDARFINTWVMKLFYPGQRTAAAIMVIVFVLFLPIMTYYRRGKITITNTTELSPNLKQELMPAV